MCKFIKYYRLILALAIGAATLFFSSPCLASNATYGALPPFLSSGEKSNVVFAVDYSGSMQFPAYYSYAFDGYYGSSVADCGDQGEVSTTYDSATVYYGYYDSAKYYTYNSTAKYWEENVTATSTSTTLTYSNQAAGYKDCLSGNFLNFIVTSRTDAVLKSMIGGRATCPAGETYCELRPQGARRWIEVSNLNADCHVRPEDYSTGTYLGKDVLITVEDLGAGTSSIGTFADWYAKVKIDSDDRTGVIQDNFDIVNFAFIGYADSSNSVVNEGTIKYGVHENDESALVSTFENTLPYSGTHTGEALREAYYYLAQSSSMAARNSTYEGDGTSVDPFYKDRDGTMEPVPCRKSFVVLISDGEWNGSIDPDGWAHDLHIDDLRGEAALPGKQNVDVYSVFAFSDSITGKQAMQTIAAFGSYNEINLCGNLTPYDLAEGNSSLANTFPTTNCTPGATYNTCCEEWDSGNGDGVPDTYYYANNGTALATALSTIFKEIRQGVSSGTAVTALTSRVSKGDVIAQAAFYPRKEFDDTKSVLWTGDIFGDWYLNAFLDDGSGNLVLVQNIREDTNLDKVLNIEDDYILEYLIENDALKIQAYEPNSFGGKLDTTVDTTYTAVEDVKNLFDCGELLRIREPSDRTIYGVAEDSTLQAFTDANDALFDSYLGTTASEFPSCLVSGTTPQYDDLINYTRGEEITACRSRVTNDSTTDENVWKIGDIIYSSPTIVEYDTYSMIYVGSNSGMLHAFRLGYIKTKSDVMNPAELCNDNSVSCSTDKIGKEEWAFLPRDSMPYLRYMADPDYDHVYAVDLKPYIIDTGSRTILIGGMRLGGACKNGTINPPTDTAPTGRSAYFAMDITDPLNPEYLWRYAPDDMGFTYSGPAYIKRQDPINKTWHHFVMFASGPTTYEGRSTQDLKIFTVELLTGAEQTVVGDDTTFNIGNAFGGRLFTHGFDANEDGQTDFIFLGVTEKADGDFDKMVGSMLKIYTGSHEPADWDYDKTFLTFAGDPITAPVKVGKCFPDVLSFPYLYFGTGRYFTADDETQSNVNDLNHIYGVPFIFDETNSVISGVTGGASINNISDSSDIDCDRLVNSNSNPGQAAWKISLEGKGGDYLRERSYADPVPTDYNIVFFDTAMPINVACQYGGRSRTWVVNCASGQSIYGDICAGTAQEGEFEVDSDIKFKYLIQLSGGDIQQKDEDDFTEEDNTVSAWNQGVPAEQGGLPTFPKNTSLGNILYWKQW
jgi:type IV pilus assembly protein PilY1